MKAVAIYKYLPVAYDESFVDVSIDKPESTGRDILVAVRAISSKKRDYYFSCRSSSLDLVEVPLTTGILP